MKCFPGSHCVVCSDVEVYSCCPQRWAGEVSFTTMFYLCSPLNTTMKHEGQHDVTAIDSTERPTQSPRVFWRLQSERTRASSCILHSFFSSLGLSSRQKLQTGAVKIVRGGRWATVVPTSTKPGRSRNSQDGAS